jgi:hypothetical protein
MRNTIINSLRFSISALVLTNFVKLPPSYAMEEFDLLAIFGQNIQDHDQGTVQNIIQNAPGNPNDLLQFQQIAPQQNAPFQGNMGFQGHGYPQQGFAWPQQNVPIQGNMGFQGHGYPQQGFAWSQQNVPIQGNMGFQGHGYPQQGFAWSQQNVPIQGNMGFQGQTPHQFAHGDQNVMMFNGDPNSNKRKFDALDGNDISEPAPKKFQAIASRHIHITAGEVFDELSCGFFHLHQSNLDQIFLKTQNYQWPINVKGDDNKILGLLSHEYRNFLKEILKDCAIYRKTDVKKRQTYLMALNSGILRYPTTELLEFIEDWRETGRVNFREFKESFGTFLSKRPNSAPISLWDPILKIVEAPYTLNGKYIKNEDRKIHQSMLICFTDGNHLHFPEKFWLAKEALTKSPYPNEVISLFLQFMVKDYRSTKVMYKHR